MSILVFGSINMDITAYVPRIPRPGETLHGFSYITVAGGKGNNQAVCCARLGAQTKFIGRVGNDAFGPEILDVISKENIDISQIFVDNKNGTGMATITVDEAAENAIVVIAGANMAFDESDIKRAISVMDGAGVILHQLEVSHDINFQVMREAKQRGLTVILDPAPTHSIPDDVFPLIDFITPNETETEGIVGIKPANQDEAAKAAKILKEKGVKTVIIKMGAKGAYYDGPQGSGFVKSFKVNPVDTVAAGDAFNGGLAVAISEGKSVEEAVRWGAAAGAIATTHKGALPAMPHRLELLKLIEEQS